MSDAVVHFEIIGSDPGGLRGFYGRLFGLGFDVGDATSDQVSAPGTYGFGSGAGTSGGQGINGGIRGGRGHVPRVLFYVGVADVEAALAHAERLGGGGVMGPSPVSGHFAVGHFTDLEGNLIGVAGPPRAEAREAPEEISAALRPAAPRGRRRAAPRPRRVRPRGR